MTTVDIRKADGTNVIDNRWLCRVENGVYVEKTVGLIRPTVMQKDLAKRLIDFLNRELSYYRWMVKWSEPEAQPVPIESGLLAHHVPRLMSVFPMDEDGDSHFVFEAERFYDEWIDADILQLASQCAAACVAYHRTLEAAEVRPDQMIKAAQGERPTTH